MVDERHRLRSWGHLSGLDNARKVISYSIKTVSLYMINQSQSVWKSSRVCTLSS